VMKNLGNIGNLMKQAQELQSKMADVQAELESLEVTGKAGGGLVSVTLTGKGQMVGVEIDASLMKPDEKEILEDLITAAHSDAKTKAEQATAEKVQQAAGNIPLPPGFNFGL